VLCYEAGYEVLCLMKDETKKQCHHVMSRPCLDNIKEVKQATVRLKKWPLEDSRVDQPWKRVRTNASRTRNLGNSRASSIRVITKIVQQATRTILSFKTASSNLYKGI
jgi:hypothetical protein